MEHYRAAVRFRPDSAYFRNALGIEYARQNQAQNALMEFQEAVRLDPREPAYLRNLDRARAMLPTR
jgi:Flp pilus assembly protein TadD